MAVNERNVIGGGGGGGGGGGAPPLNLLSSAVSLNFYNKWELESCST